MNWFYSLWPMVTGICVALSMVHLGSGLRQASPKVNLLFACIAGIGHRGHGVHRTCHDVQTVARTTEIPFYPAAHRTVPHDHA